MNPLTTTQDADSDALDQGADSRAYEDSEPAIDKTTHKPKLGESGGGAGGADDEISVPLNPVNVPGQVDGVEQDESEDNTNE